MSQRLIRIYKDLDVQEIKNHLIIVGDLSATCGKCSGMGLKMDMPRCPECQADFRYISFRNIKDHFPKIQKLLQERPEMVIVDFDDFKRLAGALKAQEFLK